jgi:hypothetical protein
MTLQPSGSLTTTFVPRPRATKRRLSTEPLALKRWLQTAPIGAAATHRSSSIR